MHIVEFGAGTLRFLDHLPAQAPAGGFLWIYLEREHLEQDTPVLQRAAQTIGGSPILHLHLKDLGNRAHPSDYDYTSVYDLVIFRRLATAMGRPELGRDPRYATHTARGERQGELDAIVAAWTATVDAAELIELMAEHGVPAGQIYRPPEMLADPHFAAREAIVSVPHPRFGSIAMQPFASIAGAASSIQTFIRMFGAAVIGMVIGQAYDDSARPFAHALLICSTAALLLVLYSEKGQLFRRLHPPRPKG